MDSFRLKVDPEVLKTQAKELDLAINRFENNWNKMIQIIKKSKSYWIGEASDVHQEFGKDAAEEIAVVLKEVRQNPKNLEKISGLFLKTENELVQLSNSLPDDVII